MAQVWHYQHGDEQHGPVSAAELKELAAAGKILPDNLIWKEGMETWVAARSVKGLFPPTPAPTARPVAATPAPARTVPRTVPPPLPDEDDDERDSPPPARPGRFGRRAKLAIAGGILVLIVVPVVGFVLLRGSGSDKARGGGSDAKTASELMRELRVCREKAHREFGGKTFTVTGKVNLVMTDGLYLNGTDEEYGSTVYCQFSEFGDVKGRAAATQQLKGIQPGQAVTLKCEFDKMTGGRTFMKKCQLTEGAGENLVGLVQKYNAHKEAFDKKYAGKRLRITGGLVNARTRSDSYIIEFETDTEDHLRVGCIFKAKYDDRLKKLKKGDHVVIEGVFKGSAFADFEWIEMLDGDLISPNDGIQKSAQEEGGSKPASPNKNKPENPSPASPNKNKPENPSTGGGEITRANYDRIRTGMTQAEVQRILGPGVEQASGDGGDSFAIYQWQNGFLVITVSFLNGKVQSKIQLGL